MKNENGIERSAILKGQTLVNLVTEYNTNSSQYASVVFVSPNQLKTNTKYLMMIKNKSSNEKNFYVNEILFQNRISFPILPNEVKTFTNITNSSIDTSLNRMPILKNNATSTTDVILEVLFIEYQDGMENWDIPCFTGMQSVKMPVLKTTGKNLFDINGDINQKYSNMQASSNPNLVNGTTIIASSSSSSHHGKGQKIKVERGEVYTCSFSSTNGGIIEINTPLKLNYVASKDSTFTFTAPTDCDEIIISFSTRGKDGNGEIHNFQLEQGSAATPYEPYKSNILSTSEDLELRGIGDVKDTLDYLTGEKVERIGEIVFDGLIQPEGIYNLKGNTIGFYYHENTMPIKYNKIQDSLMQTFKCDKLTIKDHGCQWMNEKFVDEEFISATESGRIAIRLLSSKASTISEFCQYLQSNPITVQYQRETESIKTVDLTVTDQDNQPQERMKLFPNGYINTSSSTIPPILELKGITHNNKLNMTTTNGTNNTQLTTLDNLALDGIICRDGTVVRDSYDVESGLYTKRVFRFTVDEEFVEKYRSNFALNDTTDIAFNMRIGVVANCGFPNITRTNKENANNIATTGKQNSIALGYNNMYIQILKEEVSSYDVDGILEWIRCNGAIEVAYAMDEPQIIHIQPNMTPYVSTRPYQGSIESQGNILESSFLDYTSEQSIISPKPLGDGDVLRWEQGSQCYVYENDKDYIPLTNYNQPMGTVLDLEEEDGEQFVENLDGGDIIVDVPFKEKAVYERHLVPYEDKVIYPTQDKLDPTGKIEVDYICGKTWQNPNDLSDIRHVGTLREDGQYDVTIRRSGDDEIRLMDGTTHIGLDGEGLNPSEFELTFFNSGGVEVGKYGDTSHMLEDCVLDSKLETGTVYGETLVNLLNKTTINVESNQNNLYTNINKIYEGNLPIGEYILLYNIKKASSSSFRCTPRINLSDGTALYEGYENYNITSGIKKWKFNATAEITDVYFWIDANTEPILIEDFILIEYQQGMENWDIPYFEGVGSTIVNGFTVTNSDDTEMVQYTLPTPITLNKVGDVVDTYDVVSGVETRKVTELTFNGSENWDAIFNSSSSVFKLTLPSIKANSPLLIKNGLVDGIISIAFKNNVLTITTTANFASVSVNNFKNKLKDNPITIYAQLANPQTIQHTLIPSTVETMQEPTFILPQPLRSVPNGICDRLYWDENKGHYCFEKRIERFTIDGSDDERWVLHRNSSSGYPYYYGLNSLLKIQNTGNNSLSSIFLENFKSLNGISSIDSSSSTNEGVAFEWGALYLRFNANKYPSIVDLASLKTYFNANPMNLYYPLVASEIIDLPHLNKKLTLPTQPDTLPIGYKVEHQKANPQLGLTIPYKQLNYPSRPQNIDFKMDIADYVLTWDDVKEARQYNVILNDRVIATVKEPQWNSGEEMYGYIMVEAQNELAENLSEELYIKTVPNAPAQLTVAHNPMTDYYDFEISFIKTSAIAEYYTVQYRIDNGEWVYKTIQSDEIDPNSKVLWKFSVYEINEQIEVWATATNDIGTNDILPTATYYMSPTPQWTYRINSKELFVRWMDDSPYDTQYKLRYQYKSDGIFRYAYFEGDKQEIGKLYEALIPLADDEEVSIALCIMSEKENLYTKPIKASKELDPNIKPPKNFNYHWLARGLIEFYWEDNYDVDVEYEAIVEHRLTSGNNEWITDTRIFSATDTEGTGTVYRLSYQMEDLEEIRVKVRMKWAMNETEWSESLTTVFIPVEGNPPQWIRRTQTQEGLLVEWEAQEYVDSYHVYVMSNGEELQHLETMDNFIYVDLDYSNPIDIEIYEATRFSGGIQSDPSEKMCFRPTMDKQQMIYNVVTPDTLTYEIEVDTIQKGIKERQVIHDINTTPGVKSKEPMDVAIKSPFTLSFHPLQLDVHQAAAKYYGTTELNIKTPDVKSRDAIEVLSFERITDQYGVDFTVYTPSASKYPITLEVNRVRIVCFGDSLTSGHPGFWAETGTGDPQHCYEYWLDRRLKGQYEIINKGYGSDTTDRMLARFDRDVLANNPQYCIIQGGTNDLYWAMAESMGDQEALDMKLDVMKANIMEMVKRCWDNNIVPIVGNLIPRTGATGIYKTALYDFNAWIISWCTEQAAEGRNIFYVDLFNAGKEAVPPTPIEDPTNPGAMNPIYDGDALFDEFGNIIKQGRGIHLNKEGYRIWAEAIPLSIFKTYDSGLRMYKDLHCTDEDNYDDSDKQNPFYTISIDNVRRSKTKTVVRYVKNIGKTQVLFAMYASDEYNMSIEFVGSDGEKGAYANGLLAPNMIAKVTMEINLDNKDSKASFNLHLAAREYNQN